MKSTRILPVTVLSVGVAIALTGCLPFPHAATPVAVESEAAPVPEETAVVPPAETSAPVETAPPAAPADGAVAAPGTKVGVGVAQTYEFTGTEGEKALISAKLIDVTPATAEQSATLIEGEDDLKGYQFWLIHFEETKVSGDPVEFNSDYSYYKPAVASGESMSELIIIGGFDDCATESFTDEFDAGTPLAQCIVAYAPSGGQVPAGIMYAGGYEDGNPYDDFDGKPLLFLQ